MLCSKLPQNSATQNNNIHALFYIVLGVQEFERGLAGWFWIRVNLFTGPVEYLQDRAAGFSQSKTPKREMRVAMPFMT